MNIYIVLHSLSCIVHLHKTTTKYLVTCSGVNQFFGLQGGGGGKSLKNAPRAKSQSYFYGRKLWSQYYENCVCLVVFLCLNLMVL